VFWTLMVGNFAEKSSAFKTNIRGSPRDLAIRLRDLAVRIGDDLSAVRNRSAGESDVERKPPRKDAVARTSSTPRPRRK
jgi:hypothetical protein